jgi:hypothetical protein
MGNIIRKTMCPIYPDIDSDIDHTEPDANAPIKSAEIMERDYIKNENDDESNNVVLRPPQKIRLKNEKMKK